MEVSGSQSNEGHRYRTFDSGQFTETPLLLYLFHSHAAPLHKPDSPLSQSWCKQQGGFVSGRSRAGEWISSRWHVICIGSKEGLGYDLTKGRNLCRCNSWAPQALGFVLCVIPGSKSQSDSYPDSRKTTRLHIWIYVFPTFINDRQRRARQASIIGYYVLCWVSAKAPSHGQRQLSQFLLRAASFLFISLTLCCCPLTGLQGCHFSFKEHLSGWLRLTLYLLLLRSLKGNPRWHLVEQPCQLFVCILNSSERCFS